MVKLSFYAPAKNLERVLRKINGLSLDIRCNDDGADFNYIEVSGSLEKITELNLFLNNYKKRRGAPSLSPEEIEAITNTYRLYGNAKVVSEILGRCYWTVLKYLGRAGLLLKKGKRVRRNY